MTTPSPEPIDDLLRQCPEPQPAQPHGDLLAEVAALRAGRLEDEAADALAATLAQDPEARRLAANYNPIADPALADWALEQMPAARRSWQVWLPTVAAMAAGLALIVWLSVGGGRPLPAYQAGAPQGAVSMVRGQDELPTGARALYLPESQISFTIRPEVDAEAPLPHLTVLMAADGQPLTPAPSGYTVRTSEAGAFRVTAPVGEWLGDRFGHLTLYVVLSTDDEAAAALVGHKPAEARMDAQTTRWYPIPLDYRRSADEIERP